MHIVNYVVDNDGNIIALYEVGDLVRCAYDFQQYYYIALHEYEVNYFYGIITQVDEVEDSFFTFGGLFYEVRCTDGTLRYFSEKEMDLICR